MSRLERDILAVPSLVLRSAAIVVMLSGVAIAQAPAAKAPPGPTFAKDVAPILQRSCQNCHRPDSIAPMSLLTYEEARPWARAIKDKISRREMPPWYVEKNVGIQKFKNDQALSDQEIATIAKWVDGGAPLGNPADLPTPRKFDDYAWTMGTPDLVVQIPGYTVPATGPDRFRDFYVPTGLTEDRYIKAVEGKPGPGGFRVVHHMTTFLMDPANEAAGLNDARGTLLNEYAAGKNADIFPEGSGRLIKAGTKIHLNLHYHPYGEETKDRASVAMQFYPKGYVPRRILNSAMSNITGDLDLLPGGTLRSDDYYYFSKPSVLTSFQPHMHNRGKRQCLELLYPGGGREVINCAGFVFGWAVAYMYDDNVAPLVPAGSFLHVVSWHDNSDANRGDPDPRNWVGVGMRTIDEMSFAWISWYEMAQEEFDATAASRRQTQTSNQQ